MEFPFLSLCLAFYALCAVPCCSEGMFGTEGALGSLHRNGGQWVCLHAIMMSQNRGLN